MGLTHTGAGNVRGTPIADGERAERAEALRSHSSAGDAACAAPAAGTWLTESHRGAQLCALQPGVGTGSALSVLTSAHETHTHLFAMNDTPLTTGTANEGTAATVVTQMCVDGKVQDGAAEAAGVVTATLCSQMDNAQAVETASLVACAATDMNGDTDMNGGVADAANIANATVIVNDPNT